MRQVLIHRDPESDAWLASVPSLPGYFSDGDTREEAIDHIKQAIDLWLQTAREKGWPIPAEHFDGMLCAV